MTRLLLLAALSVVTSAAAQSDEPLTRLLAARSLKCVFTDTDNTLFKDGVRSTETESYSSKIQYDNINTTAGTVRAIGNSGATDARVRAGKNGTLTFIEWSPTGNFFVTTVFPIYAKGTTSFIALSSSHSLIFQRILGQQESGTCRVWQ